MNDNTFLSRRCKRRVLSRAAVGSPVLADVDPFGQIVEWAYFQEEANQSHKNRTHIDADHPQYRCCNSRRGAHGIVIGIVNHLIDAGKTSGAAVIAGMGAAKGLMHEILRCAQNDKRCGFSSFEL